jgi:hypothetical protein
MKLLVLILVFLLGLFIPSIEPYRKRIYEENVNMYIGGEKHRDFFYSR